MDYQKWEKTISFFVKRYPVPQRLTRELMNHAINIIVARVGAYKLYSFALEDSKSWCWGRMRQQAHIFRHGSRTLWNNETADWWNSVSMVTPLYFSGITCGYSRPRLAIKRYVIFAAPTFPLMSLNAFGWWLSLRHSDPFNSHKTCVR